MRCQGVAALVMVLAAGVLPTRADAQYTVPGAKQVPEQPKYAGWVFTPSFGTGITWDDNLLLVHADDIETRDYATPISPSMRLEYRGRRTTLTSSYDGAFLLYRNVGELNSSQNGAYGRLQHRFTPRLMMFVEESFTRAPSTDALNRGGVPFYRIGTRNNAVSTGFEATLARETALRLSYNLDSVRFEFDDRLDRQLQGGESHNGTLSFSRAYSSRFTGGGQYEFRQAVLGGGDDRFSIQTAAATAEFKLTPMTAVSGLAGVSRLGSGIQHSGRIGPAVGIGISRRARLATMTASYQRTFIPSWGFGGTSQNEEWLASIHVPFARNRGYLTTRAALLDADSLDPLQATFRSLWFTTTVGYRTTRWLNVEIFYDGSRQNTNIVGGDRRRNIIGFRIVTAKPMKLG